MQQRKMLVQIPGSRRELADVQSNLSFVIHMQPIHSISAMCSDRWGQDPAALFVRQRRQRVLLLSTKRAQDDMEWCDVVFWASRTILYTKSCTRFYVVSFVTLKPDTARCATKAAHCKSTHTAQNMPLQSCHKRTAASIIQRQVAAKQCNVWIRLEWTTLCLTCHILAC